MMRPIKTLTCRGYAGDAVFTMLSHPASGQQGALPRVCHRWIRPRQDRNTMLADDLPVAETYYVNSDTERPISSSVHCISGTYETLAPTLLLVDRRLYIHGTRYFSTETHAKNAPVEHLMSLSSFAFCTDTVTRTRSRDSRNTRSKHQNVNFNEYYFHDNGFALHTR